MVMVFEKLEAIAIPQELGMAIAFGIFQPYVL